jgi:hypothetical protein
MHGATIRIKIAVQFVQGVIWKNEIKRQNQ